MRSTALFHPQNAYWRDSREIGKDVPQVGPTARLSQRAPAIIIDKLNLATHGVKPNQPKRLVAFSGRVERGVWHERLGEGVKVGESETIT